MERLPALRSLALAARRAKEWALGGTLRMGSQRAGVNVYGLLWG